MGQSLDITGQWATLPESILDGALHFRERAVTERDPFTGADTGQSARQIIAAQAATHGWPLVGIYISGSGGLVPHFSIHMSQFPVQTGNPEVRAEKLQNDINAALESIYKSEQTINDPTDPDFGQTVDIRKFFAVSKVWNYQQGGLYTPRSPGSGDFAFQVSAQPPGSSWWQRFS
jgi:hypothetical protein